MNEGTIIYHSNDLDGISSGALLKFYYPDAKPIGYDHGQPINFDINENVIFADIGFKIDKMYELSKKHNITWIDHHISKYNEYLEYKEKYGDFCEVVFNNNHAACVNVWNYLYPNKKLPKGIELLGDYDIWNNKDVEYWNNVILPFQYGMRLLCNSIETFPINEIIDDKSEFIDEIINNGKMILSYQNQINYKIALRNSFERKFNNLNAICINQGGVNSTVFDSVYDENKHDIMITFSFDGSLWHVTLYTTKENVDCSIIAKSYGGGGHKMAAGFEIKDINEII